MAKKYREVWIQGRAVNLDDPKFSKVKSQQDVRETNHFASLRGEYREKAEKDLFDALQKPKEEVKNEETTVVSAGQTSNEGAGIMGTKETEDPE